MLVTTKDGAPLGAICKTPNGEYYFVPHVPGRRSSRKTYITAEGCIPAWAKRLADHDQIVKIKADEWKRLSELSA